MRAFQTVNKAIDRLRVELHGSYDHTRLRELVAYGQRPGSRMRAALLALVVPVPCFLVLVAVDSMPLTRAEEGVANQNLAFWFRVAFCGAAVTFITIIQITQTVPMLSMSIARLWLISAFVGAALLPSLYLLSQLIGFPVPFGIQLEMLPWTVLVLGSLYVCWKDTLRANQQARELLIELSVASQAFLALILGYAAFSCLFVKLTSNLQNIVSCFLPLVKIAFKNWVDRGLHRSPHLKPVFSVFNVDLFHAMFVGSVMQQTASGSALFILMVIDVLQGVIAVYEVHSVVHTVQRTKFESIQLSLSTIPPTPLHRRDSELKAELGPLAYALQVLETSATQQNVQSKAPQERALDGRVMEIKRAGPEESNQLNALRSLAWGSRIMPSSPIIGMIDIGSNDNDPELVAAKSMLKILFMTEFYILTEYVEVSVAATYVYLYTLSYLPNRVYYTQIAMLSAEELRAKAEHVLIYAALELLSFVVFCVAVNRVMERFSLISQLGFVLEKHWQMVQSSFVVWILFVVQCTLQHFGTDYTFEFKWLEKQQLR